MKEINEKGTVFVVSDTYPDIPYTKVLKTSAMTDEFPTSDMKILIGKVDTLTKKVDELTEAVGKKV